MTAPAAAAVLAASDTGKGSPIGLFVVLVLVIAVYLLYRSMTGHLRRLPEKFPGYDGAASDGAGPGAGEQPLDSRAPGEANQSESTRPSSERPGPERPA